jgi:CBS domain-containing protein
MCGDMTSTRTTRLDLSHRRVDEVMRHGIVGCTADAPLSEVARLMSEHRVHCIVVGRLAVDGHGTRFLWGVVSDLDLVRAAANREDLTAGEIAATEPLSASPSDSLADVARVMGEHDVAHLIVLDEREWEPIGVISTLDLARAAADTA